MKVIAREVIETAPVTKVTLEFSQEEVTLLDHLNFLGCLHMEGCTLDVAQKSKLRVLVHYLRAAILSTEKVD